MIDPRTIVLGEAVDGWKDELECFQKMLLQDMKEDPDLYAGFSKHNFDDIIYLRLRELGPD